MSTPSKSKATEASREAIYKIKERIGTLRENKGDFELVIAREAAWEYERVSMDGRCHDHKTLVAIIQSYINKATEQKNHEIEILRSHIEDQTRVLESRASIEHPADLASLLREAACEV